MLTIFLPGFSIKNKLEQIDISAALESRGFKVYKHEWQHWSSESIAWDPQIELTKILKFMRASGESEFALIGKSIGTYIAAKLIKEFEHGFKIIVLMGIPINDLEPTEISEYNVLDTVTSPLYLIQNNDDPHGNIDQAREIMEGSNYKELIMDSQTHEYSYVEEILEIFNDNTTSV